MANVVTCSRERFNWAVEVIDKALAGEDVDGRDAFGARAILSVVGEAAFSLAEEVERLQLSFAFQCHIGNLSVAQVATALNMSQDEVTELTRKLPSPVSHSQSNEVTK